MKRIIYYLFFLISPFTSCVMDDLSIKSTLMWDDDFDLAPRIPSEATELEVPFIFGTSADWNVVISDPLTKSHSWCSTPQDNGTRSYEITLHLIFEPNDTAEDRVVNVTVKTLFDSVLLVVTQSGSDDALTPEGQSITYNDSFALFQSVFADSKVLTPEFVFNATESWSVECESEGDWISVSNASGEKGDLITLGVNFEENINEDEEGREGTITISTSKDEVMLTIKQHAKGVSIIPPLDFALAQTVEGSATSLDPPFVFSVQEAWTVLVTTDVDGDIDAKDTGAGDEQWLSVDQMEGEAGYNIPLAITFDANTTDPREGRVTITTDGGSSVELTIIQLGETIEITYPDGFELTQTVLSSAMSLTPSFSFSVQEAWTVAVTPAGAEQWLTADKMEGEAGDNIPLAITFEANATDVEREGTVTITANSGHSVTLEITQEGEIREIEFSYDEDFELTQTIAYNTLALDPEFVFDSPDAWGTTVTTTDATDDVSWVTVKKGGNGNDINIAFPITFDENTTYAPRTAKIILETYGDVPNIVEFNITQERKPYPDGALVLNISGQLKNDFNNQSFSTSITSLPIVGAALNEDDWAFLKNIQSLNYLDIEGTVTTAIYGESDNWSSYIPNIESILLPSTLTTIEEYAFGYCEALTSITIPEGVTMIEPEAFSNCTGLMSIDLPDGLKTIGTAAFSDCSALTSIDFPDDLTTIGESAFSGCEALTSIDLPDGLITIGGDAFYFCTALTSITLPDGLTTIGTFAFSGCEALTSITIPASVTTIDIYAFAECTVLTSIDLPDGLTEIGDGTFWDTGLTSITIPDGVTKIGYEAFDGCTSLTSITIPDGVTMIEPKTFKGCTSLTSITIPDGVTKIGYEAFDGCTGLTFITVEATIPPDLLKDNRDGVYAHFDNTNNCDIYVPSGSVETYKNSFEPDTDGKKGWIEYKDRIVDIATKP